MLHCISNISITTIGTTITIHDLLQHEISRQEFLGVAALALATVFGFGHIVEMFTGKTLANHKSLSSVRTTDYGHKA